MNLTPCYRIDRQTDNGPETIGVAFADDEEEAWSLTDAYVSQRFWNDITARLIRLRHFTFTSDGVVVEGATGDKLVCVPTVVEGVHRAVRSLDEKAAK